MLLNEGDSGSQVKYLQYGLRIICYNSKSIDGIFEPSTTTRVKQYQVFKGLTDNGKVGDSTWILLKSDIIPLQRALKNNDYFFGSIDGVASAETYNTIVSFQADHNLTADRMAGSTTLNKLYTRISQTYPLLTQGSKDKSRYRITKKLIVLCYYCGKTGTGSQFGAGAHQAVIAF